MNDLQQTIPSETFSELSSIFDAGPDMFLAADAEGNFLAVASKWTDLTGLREGSSRNEWVQAIHRDDAPAALRTLKQARAKASPFDRKYRLRCADGAYRWVRTRAYPRIDAQGKIVRWCALSEDIHEQVGEEARLRESEEHYRFTFDLSPQIPWTADPNGKVTEIGHRWLELIGMQRSEALGFGWMTALHTDDVALNQRIWSRCLATAEPVDSRCRLKQASGEYRWFRVRAQARLGAVGEVIRWYGVVEDINDQVRAEDAVLKGEERYRLATQATNDLIWDWDVATGVVECNRSTADRFGYQTEALGSTLEWWAGQVHPDDRLRVKEIIGQALTTGASQFNSEYRFLRADGSYAVVRECGYIVRDAHGAPIRAVGAMQDLSDRKLAEERVLWSAAHDALTELPNRSLFNERLEQAIAKASKTGTKVALLQLDVDHFKQVNDALGHDAGDELLRTLAKRLQRVTRSSDTVARLGGDEFAIILPDIKNVEDVSNLVESLLNRLREPFIYLGRTLDCRASVGASVYPQHGSTPEDLLKNADIALYTAKSTGRGGLIVFQGKLRADVQKRASMISVARDAIRHDLVIPFYQPKVDLQNENKIVGFEALLRWRHPTRGVQLPKTIEAAFEDFELAATISDRMIDGSIKDIRSWLDRGIEFGHVAVNASAAEFRRNDFAERVLERLASASVPASCFQLEVTETVFLGRGAEYVDRALKLLSKNGVKIALDDFGTGYASLRHLKQFPVDIIKIDQSFVKGMDQNPGDEAIIRAVVNLGHSLEIDVVAEGIETEAQEKTLRLIGCSSGQGFLYSKAVPASRVPALLRSNNGEHASLRAAA